MDHGKNPSSTSTKIAEGGDGLRSVKTTGKISKYQHANNKLISSLMLLFSF